MKTKKWLKKEVGKRIKESKPKNIKKETTQKVENNIMKSTQT